MASTIAAGAIWFVPSLIVKPSQQSALLLILQVVAAGLVLGSGRQGIDVLLLRTMIASLAAPVGWLVGDSHGLVCAGPYDCYRALVTGLLLFGIGGTAAMSMVAAPMALAWNRGLSGLRPELRWRMPATWRQWVLVAIVAAAVMAAIYLSLGIPAY